MFIREDMADIRLTVDGKAYGDSWATAAGGALTAADAKTRPGGMGREVSAGGPASRDDLTITTQMTDLVATWHHELESKIGNGRAKVSITWLGRDRLPTGETFTRIGTLKQASPPDMGSGSDVGMYTVIVSCDELPA